MTDSLWRAGPELAGHPGAIRDLGGRLRRAGYSTDLLRELGPIGTPEWAQRVRRHLRAKPLPRPQELAVSLFLLCDAVPADGARELLGEEIGRVLVGAGVLAQEGDRLRSRVGIAPVGDLLIASDPVLQGEVHSLDPGTVLAPAHASQLVADLTVREPTDIAVDVGCGQGWQSFLASRHARRVIGTDINPRAFDLTRLGAAINALPDVELRHGSFLEPLADLKGRVGLLTSNPPFVMTPDTRMTALHAGSDGDAALEGLVRGTPDLLAEGGWATIVGQWHHRDPKDWHTRPREWLGGRGCDAFLMQSITMTPQEYYQQWIRGVFPGEQGRHRWEELCREREIGAVTLGAMVLRKRAGANWLRTQSVRMDPRHGTASSQLRVLFEMQTRAAGLPTPTDVMNWPLRLSPSAHVLRAPKGTQGGQQLVHTLGLLLPLPVGEDVARAMPHFKGERPARDVLRELYARKAIQAGPDDPRVQRVVLMLVSHLFLLPPDLASDLGEGRRT